MAARGKIASYRHAVVDMDQCVIDTTPAAAPKRARRFVALDGSFEGASSTAAASGERSRQSSAWSLGA
jgi:hypothetical protein